MEYYKVFIQVFICFSATYAAIKNNPEAGMSVLEIIRYHGYVGEEHTVATEDGYILTLHRIPSGKNLSRTDTTKPVFFLQHGLLCSSADWVVNPPDKSLGFMLADHGFDVWMGNSRGNTYSKKHRSLPVDSDRFWDFTWDEMAAKDLPASIEYVLRETGTSQIFYAGHSQGTMIAFSGFSQNATLAKMIKKFYALAPVSFLGSMKSPLKYLADFAPTLQFLFKIFGLRDFLPQNEVIRWMASHLCTEPVLRNICANVVFVICGYDKPQMNETRLDVYMTHAPAGTSVKNVVHYAQAYETGQFQMYDYGTKEKNEQKYNQPEPPKYNLTNFNVPSILYYGGNDWLADVNDVQKLMGKLPDGIVENTKFISEWMHLDFLWGIDAPEEVYNNLINDASNS